LKVLNDAHFHRSNNLIVWVCSYREATMWSLANKTSVAVGSRDLQIYWSSDHPSAKQNMGSGHFQARIHWKSRWPGRNCSKVVWRQQKQHMCTLDWRDGHEWTKILIEESVLSPRCN